jgi:hypothetical protein
MKDKHERYLKDLTILIQKKEIVENLQAKLVLNEEDEHALFDENEFKSLQDQLFRTLQKLEEIRAI